MLAILCPEQQWLWVRRHPAVPSERDAIASGKAKAYCDPRIIVSRALKYCRNAEDSLDSMTAALRYRDGVFLALAFSTSLRRKNLADLRLGHSIRIERTFIRIVFESDEIKNYATFDGLVAAFLCPYIRRYVEKYRPILLQGSVDEGHLWINRNGCPLSYDALYGLFMKLTKATTGQALHPHATRYSLASSVIGDDARDIDIAADCLTHKGLGTVQRYYDQAGPFAANAAWQKILKRKTEVA